MYNLIKYAMQWYCQNLLITLSGHISVGFIDSCEDWHISAVAGTVAHPYHPMDLKRKNNYNRQVHSALQMLCCFFSIIREEIHSFFSSSNNYPTCIYLLLTPKLQELLSVMLGLIQRFRYRAEPPMYIY